MRAIKNKKNKKLSGVEAFHQFYEQIYGPEKWPALCAAMNGPKDMVKLWPDGHSFFHPEHLEKENFWSYSIDRASLAPVDALDIRPGQRILDLCAAPGGKSLAIIKKLLQLDGTLHFELISSDLSRDRTSRLQSNKKSALACLFDEYRENIDRNWKIITFEGKLWGQRCQKNAEGFDRVLLDAPCSSERHWYERPDLLKEWSESRTKKISLDQRSLLASAFDSLNPGGRLVYSTCSLSPRENEEQLIWLLEKRKQAKIEDLKGQYLLPTDQGQGPIFFSVIEKSYKENNDE